MTDKSIRWNNADADADGVIKKTVPENQIWYVEGFYRDRTSDGEITVRGGVTDSVDNIDTDYWNGGRLAESRSNYSMSKAIGAYAYGGDEVFLQTPSGGSATSLILSARRIV